MRHGWWGVMIACAAIGHMGCINDTKCGEFPLGDEERECVVSTIDEMVQQSFPFAEYKGVDLNEFSNSIWALLDEDLDDADFLADVNYTISTLKDGHTRMERRGLEEPAVAPVELTTRGDDDKAVIVSVEDDERRDLLKETVVAIDGVDVHQALAAVEGWTEGGARGEVALSGPELALAGEAGTTVELTLDSGRVVSLQRREPHNMPEVRRYGDDIGYIQIATFGFIDDLGRLDEAVNELMDTRGLIIDLRGNGGGYPSVTDGLFGRLIDHEVASFRLVDVNGNQSRTLDVAPRGETYRGEVVVLTDRRTYSASNYLSHRILYHERGVLIGERTGGGAASPKRGELLLPGVWFQVSSHVVRTPDGEHSESGLDPTMPIDFERSPQFEEATMHGLSSTGDRVMDRALRYLGGLP